LPCNRNYLLLLLLLVLPFSAVALDNPLLGNEEIRLSAEQLSYDQESRQYLARGGVEVSRGELHLFADEAQLDENSSEVFCSGDVRLTSPEGTMAARAIHYNFDDGTGVLTDGRLALTKSRMFLSGDEVERLSDTHYRVRKGSFTTCSSETPAWKFSASNLEIELGAFAQAKHAIFSLHDIPVLYLPYIAFPAKTERSSGFLLPEGGYSDRLGTEVVLPWYQVLGANQDVTFTADYMSRLGIGTGAEYRYLFGNARPGSLDANLVTAFHDDEPDRYRLAWAHDGYLPGKVRMVADGEYVNKSDYYSLFGRTANEYTTDHLVSNLFFSRDWDAINLTTLGRYTKALYADNKPVLQTLPEMRLSVMPTRLDDSPLLYALTAESTYFWRRQGEKGERLRALPSLQTDLLSNRYFELLPTAAWHEQIYWVGGEPVYAGRPEFNVAAGMRFGRAFGSRSSAHAVRHVIETRFDYAFAPGLSPTTIPQFDNYDDFSPLNRLHGQLDNRFTLRSRDADGVSHYRDFLTFGVGIDYDLYEERRQLLPREIRQPWSPVQAEMVIRPVEEVYLRGRGEFAVEQARGRMDALGVWGGFSDRKGNGLVLNYSYARDSFEYISGGVDIALLNPLHLGHETRYDLLGTRYLEHRTYAEFRGNCWSVSGSWLARPDDKRFLVTFSLSGLTGKTMPLRSARVEDWL